MHAEGVNVVGAGSRNENGDDVDRVLYQAGDSPGVGVEGAALPQNHGDGEIGVAATADDTVAVGAGAVVEAEVAGVDRALVNVRVDHELPVRRRHVTAVDLDVAIVADGEP